MSCYSFLNGIIPEKHLSAGRSMLLMSFKIGSSALLWRVLIHAAPSSPTFPPLEICNYHSLGMKTAALRPEGGFSSMLAHDRKSAEAASLSTESQWELGMASWASRPLFPSLAPGCAGGGRWKANPRTSEGHKAEYLCCRVRPSRGNLLSCIVNSILDYAEGRHSQRVEFPTAYTIFEHQHLFQNLF